jgi:hypothetical protein
MRSVFVQWPVLVDRGAALLEDLRRYTAIDTLELSNFTLDWDATQDGPSAAEPAMLALPPTDKFGDLPVPLAPPEEYEKLSQAIELASEAGFKIACNITPLYLSAPEAEPLGCVDVTGVRVPGLRSSLGVYGCASRPEIAAYAEAMGRAFVAEWPAIDVLSVNHAEFLFWPQTRVEEVLTCFCAHCQERAGAQGIDMPRVAHDLGAILNTLKRTGSLDAALASGVDQAALSSWLAFRRDAVSELVEGVVTGARQEAEARGAALQIGLETQPPALAPLVGTDIDRLSAVTDFLVVKFPDYVPASILPWLAGALQGDRTGSLLADLRMTLGLGVGPADYEPVDDFSEGILYGNAFDHDVFDLQLPLLGEQVQQQPIHAYLWKYGDDDGMLGRKIGAIEERGLDGYFLWVWNRHLAHDTLRDWPTGPVEPMGVG